MSNFTRSLMAGLALIVVSGCSDEDPCQDYVDYLCDCGAANCDDARNTYADADSKLQDQCENALQDLQDADEAAGAECSSGEDTGA